jgi:hypothetical protein
MPGADSLNEYDYLNAYRQTYQALKSADPSAWVLAPGFDEGHSSWLESFVGYEWDAFEMGLVRMDARIPEPCDGSSEERTLLKTLEFLKEAPSAFNGRLMDPVPVALWLKAGCGGKAREIIRPALWMASIWATWANAPSGPLFFEWEGGPPLATSPEGRMASLLSRMEGTALQVESYQSGLRAAARRAKDESVRLLAINENARESQAVKVSFRDQKSGLVVQTGEKRKFQFELPAESAAVITVPSAGKPTGVWYGYHPATKGEGLQNLEIH